MAVIKTMVFMTRLVLTNYTKHKHMEPLFIFYRKHINEVVGFILVICEKKDKSVGKRGPDMSESMREIRHVQYMHMDAQGCTHAKAEVCAQRWS